MTIFAKTNTPISFSLLAGDPDEGSLTFQIDEHPSQGKITQFNPITGVFTYIPDNNFKGTDAFQFSVIDNDGLKSNEVTVTIEVLSIEQVGKFVLSP